MDKKNDKIKTLDTGKIGLIQQLEDGRIIQIGLQKWQSESLQLFLASISKENPLIKMGEEYELIFKPIKKS